MCSKCQTGECTKKFVWQISETNRKKPYVYFRGPTRTAAGWLGWYRGVPIKSGILLINNNHQLVLSLRPIYEPQNPYLFST